MKIGDRVMRVVLASILGFMFLASSRDVDAAGGANPSCPSKSGYGGVPTNDTDADGGNGCVFIAYDDGSGTTFETFTYTGSVQQWTVPANVASVTFYLLGAGGGAGRDGNTPASRGGGGGYATGSYAVTAGDSFDIIVGKGGVRQNKAAVAQDDGDTNRRNVSYGGGASAQGNTTGKNFGAGGGRSAVRLTGGSNDLVTAGGGGGGGFTGAGGAGGGTTGTTGGGVGGGGGTQAAGGAGGGSDARAGTAGIKYAGGYAGTVTTGNQDSEGGGGGGGWYGGGGGGDKGGGGGGSSYVALLTSGSTTAGSGYEPGLITPVNTAPPSISGSAAIGATLTATSGTWKPAISPTWQWQSSTDGVTWSNIPGATSTTHVVTQGRRYRVVETRANILASVSANSNVIIVAAPTTTSTTTTTAAPSPTTTTSTTTTTVPTVVAGTTTTSTMPKSSTTAPSSTTAAPASTLPGVTTTTLPDPLVSYDNTGRQNIAKGASTVFGMPADGWVQSGLSNGRFTIRTSEGLAVEIGAKGKLSTLNKRGMPILETTDAFEVAIDGFRPGTDTSTWMFSTPTLLGRGATDPFGKFTSDFPIPASITPGDHTAQLNGLAPDGTLRSVEVKIEVVGDTSKDAGAGGAAGAGAGSGSANGASGGGSGGQAPLDVGLVASALVLASIRPSKNSGGSSAAESMLANAQAAGSGGGSDDDSDSKEGGEVAEVGSGYEVRAHDDRPDKFRPPAVGRIDASVKETAAAVSTKLPLLAKIIDDGSYLRALFGVAWLALPVVAAVLGVVGSLGVDQVVKTPAWWVVVAVIVLGTLDAFSGFVFAATFGLFTLGGGGFDSVVAVQGFAGLAVMAFAPSLVAGAIRPFRRPSKGEELAWNRTVDVVLLSLFGAWTVGSMYSALPLLTGIETPHSGRTVEVQLIALAVLVARWLAENVARSAVPLRLASVENASFEEPGRAQKFGSILVRSAFFAFVASVFIGNNWALWVGTAMYLYPQVVEQFADRFPNLPSLNRWLPKNLLRTVVMLFVAMWWGSLLEGSIGDSPDFALWAFVVAGLPGHLLGVADWFGREGEPWRSTLFTKVAGAGVLAVGILTATGRIGF